MEGETSGQPQQKPESEQHEIIARGGRRMKMRVSKEVAPLTDIDEVTYDNNPKPNVVLPDILGEVIDIRHGDETIKIRRNKQLRKKP